MTDPDGTQVICVEVALGATGFEVHHDQQLPRIGLDDSAYLIEPEGFAQGCLDDSGASVMCPRYPRIY